MIEGFVILPCLTLRSKQSNSAWPLCSIRITRLLRSYGPLRRPAAFQPLSRLHSYRAYLLPRISPRGIQDFSSFCRVPVIVSPPIPRRCELPPLASLRYSILSSPRIEWLDHRSLALTRPAQRSLTLQPGHLLISPKLTLSVGSSISIALHAATQARRLLALTAAGLLSSNN